MIALRSEPWTAAKAPLPGLLVRLPRAIRLRHDSRRTERAYASWIRRFVLFHDEMTQFLTRPAVEGKVSASTQNQALSVLLFLGRDVGWTRCM